MLGCSWRFLIALDSLTIAQCKSVLKSHMGYRRISQAHEGYWPIPSQTTPKAHRFQNVRNYTRGFHPARKTYCNCFWIMRAHAKSPWHRWCGRIFRCNLASSPICIGTQCRCIQGPRASWSREPTSSANGGNMKKGKGTQTFDCFEDSIFPS